MAFCPKFATKIAILDEKSKKSYQNIIDNVVSILKIDIYEFENKRITLNMFYSIKSINVSLLKQIIAVFVYFCVVITHKDNK